MATQLPEDQQLQYCGTELDVLKGVIDYADRMIACDGPHSPYRGLRRHAYGKTVVIESAREGKLVFRLSASPNVYPNFASGYATPHSPVGRLCSFVRPGYEGSSPKWGSYRVVETRLFDRFDGLDFEDNVRNFLRMVVEGDKGKGTVTDLLRTLQRDIGEPAAPAVASAPPPAPVQLPATPHTAQAVPPAVPHPALQFAHLEVADDEAGEELSAEFDDSDEPANTERGSGEGYYGLSEVFYVNRTDEQNQVIARSPLGVMFVEGVAGSGKTSAALGRTKLLCDFNEANVTEESEFREYLDESHAHWSGKFAGKFSQEGSVGFVRTGELIQYLKETCRRIDLSNLPVAEYKELQIRLRQHRRVERSGIPGWRWSLEVQPRGAETDTTMTWLQAADRAVSSVIAERLGNALPDSTAISSLFAPEQRTRIDKVVAIALASVREALKAVQTALRSRPVVGRFGLDQLADNLARVVRDIRTKILGKDVLWVVDGEQAIYATNEHALAGLLTSRKIPLYLRNSSRLVILDESGPVDGSIEFLSQEGEPLSWDESIRESLKAGSVAVKGEGGQTFLASASDIKDITLKLLPEAIDKLYVMRGGRLHPLKVYRGLGRIKFELLQPEAEPPDDGLEDADQQDQIAAIADQKYKTLDALLRQRLQSLLLQPLAYLADVYMEALGKSANDFPEPALARRIYAQMQNKKLTDEDIDLLLCLAHMAGRGFEGNPAQLRAPGYYQSVFIDEVQDFTEQQIYLMAEQAKPDYRAVTVVGDIAQKLHHGSRIDIRACFPGIKVDHVRLGENLRQLEAPGLSWFSACFRAELQDGVTGIRPTGELLRRLKDNSHDVKGPELLFYDDGAECDEQIVATLRKVPPRLTAAVILPSGELAVASHQRLLPALRNAFVDAEHSDKVDLARRHVRHFTSVLNAKGLEFDVVVLPYLEAYDLADCSHVNRLYVGLTRARKRLVLLADRSVSLPRFDPVWSCYKEAIATLTLDLMCHHLDQHF